MGAMANPSSSSSSAQLRSSKLTSVIVGRVAVVLPTPPVVAILTEPDFPLSFLPLSSFPFFGFFFAFVSSAAKAFWPATYPGFCPLLGLHAFYIVQDNQLCPTEEQNTSIHVIVLVNSAKGHF